MNFKLLNVKPSFESTFDKVYMVIFQLMGSFAFLVLGYSTLLSILYAFEKRREPISLDWGSLLWLMAFFSISLLLFLSAIVNSRRPVSKK
jgi:hypothetical protein